jgi:uncharacterized repeat protein (TIGR03803 family)
MKLARFVCRLPFVRGISLSPLSIIVVVILSLNGAAGAAEEAVLHNFRNSGTAGASPRSGLISDAAGNLYGTTTSGGRANVGTVFELSPNGAGGWTEKVLHSFGNGGYDGNTPLGGLIFDTAGNLYGTTPYGGQYRNGVVFQLSLQSNGTWKETILHAFRNPSMPGEGPFGNLIFDGAGNLYGAAEGGGANGVGTVFELMPTITGPWTVKILHVFNYVSKDAYFPLGGLIFDAAGNLYGTTWAGGNYAGGVVFELMPNIGGGWTLKVLHSFRNNAKDGRQPHANLIFDGAGNLYGTTASGGAFDGGTVFQLTAAANGTWTETVLHSFQNDGSDGYTLLGGLTLDAAGNLYGTTSSGGSYDGGTVFKLTPETGGGWTETLLRSFNDNGKDGSSPYPGGPLIFDPAGNMYGTTVSGGTGGVGTVFEITP